MPCADQLSVVSPVTVARGNGITLIQNGLSLELGVTVSLDVYGKSITGLGYC